MAAFGTDTKFFSRLFNAKMEASGSFTAFLNDTAMVPAGARAGAITTRITTAVTLQAPADGTMLANNAARTEVNLVAFRGIHTLSLFPDELAQWDADADAREFDAFVNAARKAAELEIITDWVAATLTAPLTSTLPVGQIDFACDGTDAEIFLALNALDQTLSQVEFATQGKPGRIGIVTHPIAWGNLRTLSGMGRLGAQVLTMQQDVLFYKGRPVFLCDADVAGYADGAGEVAAFVFHTDAEALVWDEVFIPHEAPRFADDGLFKKFWYTYGFAGGIQLENGHLAQVLNPSA